MQAVYFLSCSQRVAATDDCLSNGDDDDADDGDDGDGGDGDDEFDDTDADTNITTNFGSLILSFGNYHDQISEADNQFFTIMLINVKI